VDPGGVRLVPLQNSSMGGARSAAGVGERTRPPRLDKYDREIAKLAMAYLLTKRTVILTPVENPFKSTAGNEMAPT
jgi:hypothetical protein